MTITPDVRLEYLEGVASIMLKFKPDKWGKMLSVEEHLAWLMDFLEKPDVLVLVLTLSPAGTIVPCLGFPASLKTKGVYFVKKKPKNISKDNYKDALLYGDLSPTPVDQLIAVVEEVGVPGPPPAGARGRGRGELCPSPAERGPRPSGSARPRSWAGVRAAETAPHASSTSGHRRAPEGRHSLDVTSTSVPCWPPSPLTAADGVGRLGTSRWVPPIPRLRVKKGKPGRWFSPAPPGPRATPAGAAGAAPGGPSDGPAAVRVPWPLLPCSVERGLALLPRVNPRHRGRSAGPRPAPHSPAPE